MKNLVYTFSLATTLLIVSSCHLSNEPTSIADKSARQANHKGSTDLAASSQFVKSSRENQVDQSIQKEYEVRNGVIHFKDLDTYLKTKSLLKQLSASERIKKVKISGFTSLLESYQKYFEEVEKDSLHLKSGALSKEYQDIVSIVDKDGKQEFLNSELVESALLNRNGLVYIGKILYRFTDKRQDIVADGDPSKLGSNDQMVMSISDPIIPLSRQARVAAAGCNGMWKSKRNLDEERQIALHVYLKKTQYISGSNSRVECMPFAFGVPYKKDHLGYGAYDWVNYRTNNHISSIWRCTVVRSDNFESKVANDNYAYDNDWNTIEYGGTVLTFENVPFAYGTPSPQFSAWFELGGGYYYSRGVPFDQRIDMVCP